MQGEQQDPSKTAQKSRGQRRNEGPSVPEQEEQKKERKEYTTEEYEKEKAKYRMPKKGKGKDKIYKTLRETYKNK